MTTKIATVAIGIVQAMQTGQAIFTIVADAMDAVEAQGATNGADKKAWVLAYAKNVVLSLGQNWDTVVDNVSAFIDQVKTAYNAVKSLFK